MFWATPSESPPKLKNHRLWLVNRIPVNSSAKNLNPEGFCKATNGQYKLTQANENAVYCNSNPIV